MSNIIRVIDSFKATPITILILNVYNNNIISRKMAIVCTYVLAAFIYRYWCVSWCVNVCVIRSNICL